MMRLEDMQNLARAIAGKYGLSPSLVCAVCQQESSWNQYAIRYEAAFFAKYVAPLFTNGKIDVTEAYARAFSWGLMQVMGEVAREFGFDGSLAVLTDPAANLDIGCKVLKHKLDRANGDVEKGLLSWNGGANKDYPTQVMARIPQYSAQATELSMQGDV